MRRIGTCAGILLLAGLPAHAADVKAKSAIDAVTVFPSGAEVRRVAKIKLDGGDHTVILEDLPLQAVPSSIRVEGKASGRLEIGSVDTRRLTVARADAQAMAADRRAIEDEIRALRDQRAGVEAEIATAEQQKAFIANLVQLPTRPPAAGVGTQPVREDWPALMAFIAQENAKASRAVLDAQIKLRRIDEDIRDRDGKLRAQPPQVAEVVEVRVNVAAGQPLDAEFTVSYQVTGASWAPLYEARLSTGTKTAAPKLALTRRAQITQRTGEPWTGVQLALSTTQPQQGSAAPDLRPVTLDFMPDRPPPPPAPLAMAPAAGAVMREERLQAQTARAKMTDEENARSEPVAAVDRLADVDASAFQAVFAIPGRTDVANTGAPKRVTIEEAQLEPALVARTVPRTDARAFLYAKMTMPRATPYLPGPVSLFRDNTFVGTGRLPKLGPGEEHELGFGADDLIRVRTATVDDKKSEGGIIASMRTEQKTYRVTVKNMRDRPVQITVMDQVPVSAQQDIKVETTAKPQPSRRDVEDKRGVLAWDDRLNADEEKSYELGTKITWPSGKQVIYR